jgi:TM2 domain-containing protein
MDATPQAQPPPQPSATPPPQPPAAPVAPPATVSDRKRLVALLLCFFLGILSVHRFYVGKIGTAILQIVTFGGLGIWLLVDFILILVGAFKDKQGRPVEVWT